MAPTDTPSRRTKRRRAAHASLLLFVLSAGCAGEPSRGRPWVHKLRFHGVKQVKVKELRARIALEQSSWNRLSPRRWFEPFSVESDRPRIEAFYRERGYYHARVVSTKVTPRDAKPTSVDVDVTLEEGPATTVETLAITGIDGADGLTDDEAAAMKRDLPLGVGEVFAHPRYLLLKEALEVRLKSLGHAWADVTGEVEVDRDLNLARLRVRVTPGPRAAFAGIEVRGTRRVDPKLVARFARLPAGELFHPAELAAIRGRVYNLGVFSSVKVDVVADPEDPARARVVLDVIEGSMNEVRLGGGIGVESQRTDVHLSLRYTRRNFLGGLRTLTLRLEPAYVAVPAFWQIERHGPAATFEAQLVQPAFPWKLAQVQLSLGYDLGIEYAYQFHGPRARLALSDALWKERVALSLSYNFQLLDFFETDPAILADPAQAGRLFGYVDPYRVAWLQLDASLDLRDRALDAHSGFWAQISGEAGGAWTGSAFQYEKLTGEVRGYAPLGRPVTLAVRTMYSRMFAQGDLGSPITRRSYLGGATSHRGFSFNRLAPQVASGIADVPALPVGGEELLLGTVELRADLFKLFGSYVAIGAFLDAGDVVGTGGGAAIGAACPDGTPLRTPSGIDARRLHYAAGGGLRYRTIIGAIRADLGVRLNRLDPCEPDGTPNPDPGARFAFHLSVGEAF